MKNRRAGKATRDLLFLVALSCLSFVLACQKAQVAEYKKYEKDADVPRISVQDAKKEIDAGTAIIVDSRPEFAYKNEHVTGAINIVFGTTDDKFAALPKDKKIIIYCS